MVGSLPAEPECVHDRSWVRCHEWPGCFVCAINHGFFAANGRAALLVQSIIIRGFVAADGRGFVAPYTRSVHQCSIVRHRAMPGHIVRMTLPLTGPSSCLHGN